MDTIKSSTEISSLFKRGTRLDSPCITILVDTQTEGHGPTGRVAFIAGKKLGGAVWRNKAKRRMREIAREAGAPWDGYDVVFIAKKRLTEEMYSKVLQQTENLIATYFSDREGK